MEVIIELDILNEKIKDNKIDDAIRIIEEIGEKKYKEAVPFLIEQLENTSSKLLRNSIALALSDIGDSEAVVPIVNLLKDPKTIGARGSLLYALQVFDYSEHIELLVSFLYEGNFEVSRNSYILIENIIKDLPEETKEKCVKMIRNEIEKLEEKVDFLYDAVDIFSVE